MNYGLSLMTYMNGLLSCDRFHTGNDGSHALLGFSDSGNHFICRL